MCSELVVLWRRSPAAPCGCGSVPRRPRTAIPNALFQPVAQVGKAGPVEIERSGFAKCAGSGDIFSAGSAVAFVMSTVQQGGQIDPLSDEESAHTFRRSEFVPADGVQVNAEIAHVDR